MAAQQTQPQDALAARLKQLEDIYYSGVSRASYEGKSSEFVDPSKLLAMIQSLRRQLGIAQGNRRTVAGFRSGF